jgi:hypothetical protein
MIDVFNIIKQRVDILQAAEMFGIQIDRHGKALCIFHNDTHPSMSFKDGHFTCFSCGAHGDVFDLVSKITGSTGFETAKQLNDAFHLGLDLDKPVKQADITKLHHERQRVGIFKTWEHDAFITVNQYAKHLNEIIQARKPTAPDEAPDQLFIQALHEWDKVNYILDMLTFGDWPEKIECFKYYRKEVERYGQAINCGDAEWIGSSKRGAMGKADSI